MTRFNNIVIWCIFLVFTVSNVSLAKALPIVSIKPISTNISVGEEFSIKVVITREDIVNMAGWNCKFLFNSDILSVQKATVGDFVIPHTDFSYSQSEPGIVKVIEFGLSQSTISGQGIIVVLNFIALKPGRSPIELSDLVFSNLEAKEISVDLRQPITRVNVKR